MSTHESRLVELEARVRVVEDLHAISQLVASYGPAVDSGSAEAAGALWTDDGVFDVVPWFELQGPVGVAGMVDMDGHQQVIQNGCGHVLTAPKVELHGDDATAWNYAFHIRFDADADRFWIARLSANEWRCRREPEGWRVVRRTNVNLDGNDAARALLGRASQRPEEAR